MTQNNQERLEKIIFNTVMDNLPKVEREILASAILEAIELDVIKMTDILLTQPSIKDYETLPEHTLNSAIAIASAKDKVVKIK